MYHHTTQYDSIHFHRIGVWLVLEARGPVKILEDKQSSQRVMALALSEILPTGCKFQMDREASKVEPNTPPENSCLAHQCVLFALGLSLPRYHCILQDPNLCSRSAVNVMSSGHHLPNKIYKQIFCRFLSTTCFVLNIQFFQSLASSHRLPRRNDYITYHTESYSKIWPVAQLPRSPKLFIRYQTCRQFEIEYVCHGDQILEA